MLNRRTVPSRIRPTRWAGQFVPPLRTPGVKVIPFAKVAPPTLPPRRWAFQRPAAGFELVQPDPRSARVRRKGADDALAPDPRAARVKRA